MRSALVAGRRACASAGTPSTTTTSLPAFRFPIPLVLQLQATRWGGALAEALKRCGFFMWWCASLFEFDFCQHSQHGPCAKMHNVTSLQTFDDEMMLEPLRHVSQLLCAHNVPTAGVPCSP